MSKSDAQYELVPRLRFPEFRKTGVWQERPLGELTDPITEQVGVSACVPYTVTSGEGLISQEDKYGRTIAGKSLKNYYRLQRDDFAFNKSATKSFPQGYIARFQGDERAAVPNSIFTCFRIAEEDVDAAYLDYLFQGNLHGRWLKDYITVGARAHGALSISDDDLYALPVPLPPSERALAEQQKIAECLGSLDDLIVAAGRKLVALRDHKSGLMQQLFPQDGKTQPRLRFPEFKNAAEWEIRPIAQVAENLDSKRIPITGKDRTEGEIPYYGASGIVDYVDDYIFDEELLCISEDGANLLTRTYPIAFSISGRSWVNNHAHVLRFDHLAQQTLVEAYLNVTDLKDFITGMAQPKLNRGMLDTIPIPLPRTPAEQQRIADCLSALDALIAAQAEKLDVLCSQKRGLMQQLFPTSETVTGGRK